MQNGANERTQLIVDDTDESNGSSSPWCLPSYCKTNNHESATARSSTKIRPARICFGVIVVLGLMAGAYYVGLNHHRERPRFPLPTPQQETTTTKSTNSKYKQVQGIGFQIYTGGAPALIEDGNGTSRNPECHSTIGQVVTDTEPELQCYLGVSGDAMEDARRRLEVMKQAVMQAHESASNDAEVLKVFVAPEFFWRGADGAYIFAEEAPGDDSICGPICYILGELESFVANERFEDWVFLFGTIIASEVLTKEDAFDYLFYNFAPVYKGFDPHKIGSEGKRFLLPKRFVSSSDFLTPQRNLDLSAIVEVLGSNAMAQLLKQDTTVNNPFDSKQKRYDDHIWKRYKSDQSLKG